MSNLEHYLTDQQKQDIAEEMFREKVAEHLKTDVQVTNFIYRINAANIHAAVAERMGADWMGQIYEHTKKAITQLSSHDVFREASRYGDAAGPGRAHMIEAVNKHAARIEGRVLKRIEEMDDYDLGDLLRSALAKKLGGDDK